MYLTEATLGSSGLRRHLELHGVLSRMGAKDFAEGRRYLRGDYRLPLCRAYAVGANSPNEDRPYVAGLLQRWEQGDCLEREITGAVVSK